MFPPKSFTRGPGTVDEEQGPLKERLFAHMKVDGNNKCADCGRPDPDWVSTNLGCFMCLDCSGVHRSIGTHISKIRSVKLDRWEEDSVANIESTSNNKVNAKYLADVPYGFKIPTHTDAFVLREQAIRAKYERLEFSDNAGEYILNEKHRRKMAEQGVDLARIVHQSWIVAERKGHMLKKGGSKGAGMKKRWFVLADTGLLYYFKESNDFQPAGCLELRGSEIVVPDEEPEDTPEMSDAYQLQIVAQQQQQKSRTYEILCAGPLEVYEWMETLTCIKARLDRDAHEAGRPADRWVCGETRCIRDPLKEGWLTKQGGQFKSWKKRWFALTPSHLYYFGTPEDHCPLGEIPLTGCEPLPCTPDSRVTKDHAFQVKTTGMMAGSGSSSNGTGGRTFFLCASSADDQQGWLRAIGEAASQSERELAARRKTAPP